ncbi:MAG: hemolysin family protein [Thermoplasmatota archaeon]
MASSARGRMPSGITAAIFVAGFVSILIGFVADSVFAPLSASQEGLALLALGAVAGVLFVWGSSALWRPRRSPDAVTEAELRHMVRVGAEQGILEKTERDLIEGVLRFTDTEVRRIMVPKPQILAISVATAPDEVVRFVAENKYSRYPVYERSINDIIGFLYYKDLLPVLREGKTLDLRSTLRPPLFVPETMKLSTLLKELQRRRLEMAIVVNEHGNVEGVVTLEDLLEQIVGEIQDEYDVEERRIERQKDGSWIIDASMVVDDLPSELHKAIPIGEGYQTVAGFALASLGHLPKSGESWDTSGYHLTIVALEGRRISKVKVEPKRMLG